MRIKGEISLPGDKSINPYTNEMIDKLVETIGKLHKQIKDNED